MASACGSSSKPISAPLTVATSVAGAPDPTSSVAGSTPGADDSACQLLSDADVIAAMKRPMKVVGGAGAFVCTWAAVSDPSVLLAVQTFATRSDAALYTQIEPSSEHVDGLGDDAFWNSTLDMVFVRKGERGFAVTSPSLVNLIGDPQASKTAMVHLATIVLAKF